MQNPSFNQSYFQQPMPSQSNSLIYTEQSLYPYNSQQFLTSTFHSNSDYINAFLTLPHQLKLKMYLSVQEMKMMGRMNDREGYAEILKEIAKRVSILKPQLKSKQQEEEPKDWGHKLEDLCQNHLKKIQQDDLLDNLPVQIPINENKIEEAKDFLTDETAKNEEEDWEWNQEVTQETKNQSPKKKTNEPSPPQEEEQNWEWEQPTPQVNGLSAVTFQKQQQPIDIWSLNVDGSESKKVIAQVFQQAKQKTQEDQFDDYQKQDQINFQYDEQSLKVFQQHILGKGQQEVTTNQHQSELFINEQEQVIITEQPSLFNQPQTSMNEPIFDFSSLAQSASSLPTLAKVTTSQSVTDDFDIFLDKTPTQQQQVVHSQEPQLLFEEFSKKQPQNLVKSENIQKKVQGNHWAENFEIFQSTIQPQPSIQLEIKEPSPQEEEKKEDMIPAIDTSILDQLRVKLNQNQFYDCLKKNIFDVQQKFYENVQAMLKDLGYEHSNDYAYIKGQEEICKEIVILTEMYTAAVEEDQEDLVRERLAQSKQKYTELNTKRTSKVVEKYLKMEGKGQLFRVGQLLLRAGIPKQQVQKSIGNRQVLASFTILYAMSSLNSLKTILSFTKQLIPYFQIQYQIYKQKQELLSGLGEHIQQIKNHQQYQRYRQGLSKLANLCRRMLSLVKLISNQRFHPNTLKLGKQLKEVEITEAEEQPLIPEEYCEMTARVARKDNNVYVLYNEFTSLVKNAPICQLCLRKLQKKGEEQKGIHYGCYNVSSMLQATQ